MYEIYKCLHLILAHTYLFTFVLKQTFNANCVKTSLIIPDWLDIGYIIAEVKAYEFMAHL